MCLKASNMQFPQNIERYFTEKGARVLFVNARRRAPVRSLLREAVVWLGKDKPRSDILLMMMAGVPNVGKSTLINALRNEAK